MEQGYLSFFIQLTTGPGGVDRVWCHSGVVPKCAEEEEEEVEEEEVEEKWNPINPAGGRG